MKTALDVQREMNNYQPRYQKKTIRQKLEQAISSREYEKFSEKYLDRVITHSIVRNQTARSYEDKEYPFVILEKWIKYDDFLTRLVLIAYLDNKEREIFLNSKKMFADIVCKVKHLVKAAMKKRGFKYQQSINLYLDAEGKTYGDLFPCFVIQPKLSELLNKVYVQIYVQIYVLFVCSMIIGLVICLIGNIFFHIDWHRIAATPIALLILFVISLLVGYLYSKDEFKDEIHSQQQILLEKEERD